MSDATQYTTALPADTAADAAGAAVATADAAPDAVPGAPDALDAPDVSNGVAELTEEALRSIYDWTRAGTDNDEAASLLVKAAETASRLDELATKDDIAVLRTDVDGLRTDFAVLRTDVDGLRTDVNDLRTDVDGLRTDVDGLRENVDSLRDETRANRKAINKLRRASKDFATKADLRDALENYPAKEFLDAKFHMESNRAIRWTVMTMVGFLGAQAAIFVPLLLAAI